jgi:hypothetical protein
MLLYPNYLIIISSTLFILPIIYGILKCKFVLSFISIITMFFSIHYWFTGNNIELDLFFSKLCGIMYFIYGYFNIKNNLKRLYGYINLFFILFCYNTSCVLYNLDSELWVIYHMLFHLYTIISKIIILE